MTYDEKYTLTEIVSKSSWDVRNNLLAYLAGVTPENPATVNSEPHTRSLAQNDAVHVWFRQIAEACKAAGIDAQLLFSKTVSLEVSETTIKSLWHAIQKSYFNTDSTTKLTKHQQIDKIADTMIRFFAERHHLELPPFPSQTNVKVDYPEFNGAPLV